MASARVRLPGFSRAVRAAVPALLSTCLLPPPAGGVGGLCLGWLGAVALGASAGCAAGSQGASPRDTLRQYALALRGGHPEDAYALLSREAQSNLSLAEFTRMASENASEIQQLTGDLLRPAEDARVTATLTSPDGETLVLVYEGDAWRVHASALDLYGQYTPETALAAFVRAYDNQRYDVLMRFVPDDKREGLTAEGLREAWEGEQREQMDRLTQALKASLPNVRVERIGTRATVEYGAGATVELIHERGVWKIEDF